MKKKTLKNKFKKYYQHLPKFDSITLSMSISNVAYNIASKLAVSTHMKMAAQSFPTASYFYIILKNFMFLVL